MRRFLHALLVAVPVLGSAAIAPAKEPDLRERVHGALGALDPEADGPAREAASLALHGLGPAAVPLLVERLWRTASAAGAPPSPRTGASTAVLMLPEVEREAILGALARHGPAVVRPSLALDKVAEMTAARRVVVITVLGAFDDAASLGELLRVSAAPYRTYVDPAATAPVVDATRAALVRRVRGRPADVHTVAARWNSLPAAVRSASIDAAAATPHPETWRFLAEVVQRDVGLRGEALTALVDAPPPPGSEAAELAAAAARFEIADPNSEHRPTAARLLGRVRDEASIPPLVTLCGAEDEYVLRSAATALREITGLRLADDAGCWTRWLARENEWFETRAPEALDAVADGDVQRIVPALQEISERRTRRGSLAQSVTFALHHVEPTIRIVACRTLERLGVAAVADELRRLLIDPVEDVRRAAERALAALEPRSADEVPATGAETRPLKSAIPSDR